MLSFGRIEGDRILDNRRTAVGEIKNCIADFGANPHTSQSRRVTATLEDVLLALYGEGGIPGDELKIDMEGRFKGCELERPAPP
jgi:hypothetical protein